MSGPTVDPVGTGIVFVVLVAIWVAYLIQYWSRRREHLATARSVEAFSEAMRVLERRPVLRRPTMGQNSSAYLVSPARAVSARPAPRPQVMAKPRPAPPRSAGVPGMRMPTSFRPSPQARSGPTSAQRPVGRPGAARVRPSRKLRGLAFLFTLVATLVLLGLSAFSVLLWWAPLIGVAAVMASFFWLRSAVQAEIKARRARRRPARRGHPGVRRAPAAAAAPAASATVAPAPREEVVDLAVGHEAERHEDEAGPVADTSADAGSPDGWSPVPVPPPTYTLKAKAQPRTAASFEASTEEPDLADLENPFAPPAAAESSAGAGEQQEQARAAYGT